MTFFSAIILGIIEGLTEFFPISSTGHLIIAETFMGITAPSLFFNVLIQLGAMLAVVVYFRQKLCELVRSMFTKSRTAWLYGIGSVPVLVVGAVFHSTIVKMQKSVFVVALATLIVAGVMAVAQRIYRKTLENGRGEKQLSALDFLVVGVFQALSVIPGISRSGITMIGALSRKLSFTSAMETAFLLGIPAMAAASAFEGFKLLTSGARPDPSLLGYTVVGFVTAFAVSLLTIWATLPILKKYGFTPFILYRIAIGLFLLWRFPLTL